MASGAKGSPSPHPTPLCRRGKAKDRSDLLPDSSFQTRRGKPPSSPAPPRAMPAYLAELQVLLLVDLSQTQLALLMVQGQPLLILEGLFLGLLFPNHVIPSLPQGELWVITQPPERPPILLTYKCRCRLDPWHSPSTAQTPRAKEIPSLRAKGVTPPVLNRECPNVGLL